MSDLDERLQAFCDDVVAADGAPQGCIVGVSWPDGTVARASAGQARADRLVELNPSTPFHVASVGKVFTAILVLQLAEAGAFGDAGIDATLVELAALGLLDPALAVGLHPESARITIRQLLSHTSGMKDAQVDDAVGTAEQHGGLAPGSIIGAYARSVRAVMRGRGDNELARQRWRAWNPDAPDYAHAGHLNWFLVSGAAATPVAAPGERFHYSDTGYVVLATVVEAACNAPLSVVQRERILDPLGLASTYLAYHDDPTPDARSREMDVWLGDVPLLSEGFDLSFDWGGGGQVSTVDDLLTLVRAVNDGRCSSDATMAAAMLAPTKPPGLGIHQIGVGLGVQHWRLGDRAVIGHAGAWGVRAFIDPRSGIAIAATVGRRDDCVWLSALFDVADSALESLGSGST